MSRFTGWSSERSRCETIERQTETDFGSAESDEDVGQSVISYTII